MVANVSVCVGFCACRKLYKEGKYVEAYAFGSEAMKIHSGHERANRLVAKIRDVICKFVSLLPCAEAMQLIGDFFSN